MTKKLLFIQLFALLFAVFTMAQTTTPKESKPDPLSLKTPLFGISFSGYVKTDILYDTRQTVGLRDGQFLLYPEPVKPDATGTDINARGNFDILSIQTRITGNITGPDALGAKTSGLIEAEFFGNTNTNINTFRLRHAYVRLNWPKTELLVGQTWHPMFSPNCYPMTVSFNTGAMFAVFSRNPQVRVTRDFGHFSITLAALSQLDFTSTGPDGPSTKYARNATVPEFDFQVQYQRKTESNEFLVGAGIDYLGIIPRLSTDIVTKKAVDTVINNVVVHENAVTQTYMSDERVNAVSYNFMAKLKVRPITAKIGAFFGENCYGFTLLGGYAVKNTIDASRGQVEYAPLRTMTVWGEVSSNGKTWQPGIFGGFSRNLGVGDVVTGPFYARGSDIDYVYRISPRLVVNISKVRIAAELEYTVAAYGKTNEKGYVYNSSEVSNLRMLLGVYYFF
jgi:hypothetical protein